MPYQIKREESVNHAARRIIIGEQLDDALEAAGDPRVTVDERIHRVRVALKRARAVVALVAPGQGRAATRANRALREIGRGLATSRDRAVAREALARVSKQVARSGRVRGASKLGPELRRHLSGNGAEARLEDAVGGLEDARRTVRRLRVTHGRRAVASGFEGAYKRARRAFRQVDADADDDALFHEWRKIVKRLGYQVALLGDAASSSFGALEPLLDRLGKLLGDLHDVAFLRAAVAEVGAARDLRAGRDRWLAFLDARARDLRAEARALGIPLFAEAPSIVKRRVESDWSRWRR